MTGCLPDCCQAAAEAAAAAAAALARGKRSKAKKAKEKYAHQDEEDRQLALEFLAPAGTHLRTARLQQIVSSPFCCQSSGMLPRCTHVSGACIVGCLKG